MTTKKVSSIYDLGGSKILYIKRHVSSEGIFGEHCNIGNNSQNSKIGEQMPELLIKQGLQRLWQRAANRKQCKLAHNQEDSKIQPLLLYLHMLRHTEFFAHTFFFFSVSLRKRY